MNIRRNDSCDPYLAPKHTMEIQGILVYNASKFKISYDEVKSYIKYIQNKYHAKIVNLVIDAESDEVILHYKIYSTLQAHEMLVDFFFERIKRKSV